MEQQTGVLSARPPIPATDPKQISNLSVYIKSGESFKMQVNKRVILNPILKKYKGKYVDAIGSIDIEYDLNIEYAVLTNVTKCDLEIFIRIL